MLRAAALSILMLLTVVTMLPLTSSSASNEKSSVSSSHRKRVRRHSRAWWRRYRARQRRKRARMMARRRALQALRMQNVVASNLVQPPTTTLGGVFNHPRGLFSVTMPTGWSSRPATDGNEMNFRILAGDNASGQATLSMIAIANGSADASGSKRIQNKTLGGIPLTTLRRVVIDKMIKDGGWVVNDFQREIAGRRVFVVQAQTPGSNDGRTSMQTKTYYFAEVDGRIYSLATAAPVGASELVATGSEQLVGSFQTTNRAKPTAALLR